MTSLVIAIALWCGEYKDDLGKPGLGVNGAVVVPSTVSCRARLWKCVDKVRASSRKEYQKMRDHCSKPDSRCLMIPDSRMVTEPTERDYERCFR